MRTIFRLVVALALACAATTAFGQEPCGPTLNEFESHAKAAGYDEALKVMQLCLGDPAVDPDPIVATYNRLTPDKTDADAGADQRRDAIQAVISALREYSLKHADVGLRGDDWRLIVLQLDQEQQTLATVGVSTGAADNHGMFPATFWPTNVAPNRPTPGGHIDLFAPTGCAAPPAACPAYENQKDLIRVFKLVMVLGKYALWKELDAHLADANLQSDRWKSYFNDALPQYWWEVGFNGAFMGSECEKDPTTKIQRGFCRVPTHQWILAHPEAALQWVNSATSTSDLNPAFAIELFGRNSWSWKQDKAGAGTAGITRNFGYSAVAVYSNRGAAKKWSYGLMFHFLSGYTLGVTTTGDHEFGLVVNSNLAANYFGRRQKYIDYLKALDKPALLDLISGQ